MTITGGCRCGACRYTIDWAELPAVYACHCHVCQRWSGSAYGVQALVGETQICGDRAGGGYEKATEDRTSVQRVCGECHSRLYNTNSRRPDIAVVRAGTLDRSEELMCRAHIFANYKQGWVRLDDDLPQWGEAADPNEFIAVMMR